MKHCLVIHNPYSGKYIKRDFKDKFLKELSDNGYESKFITTDYQGHAKRLVKDTDADLVISIGGDGTFSEIINGNNKREKKVLLSHIPLGTANDIGSMYGYDRGVIKNLKLILNGDIKEVDLCTINETPFVYVTGFGKFFDVSYTTSRDMKKKYGYLAYLMKALEEFKSETPKYHIRYINNGKFYEAKCAFLLITNSTRVAGTKGIYKNVSLDDGKFEVLMTDVDNRKDMISKMCSLLSKNGETDPRFTFFRTNKFQVEFDKESLTPTWCIDGDEMEENTNSYVIETKGKVKLLLPKKNLHQLFSKKD